MSWKVGEKFFSFSGYRTFSLWDKTARVLESLSRCRFSNAICARKLSIQFQGKLRRFVYVKQKIFKKRKTGIVKSLKHYHENKTMTILSLVILN